MVEVNGKPTSFPLREFELLEYLVRQAGRVRSRRQILDYGGVPPRTDNKTLDVHIKRLRQKIEEDPTALVTSSRCAEWATSSGVTLL